LSTTSLINKYLISLVKTKFKFLNIQNYS